LTLTASPEPRGAMPKESTVLPEHKVVHVIAPLEVGGAESVVRELASHRHRLGGSTEVAVLLDARAERREPTACQATVLLSSPLGYTHG
jgi:hypothetical protein